MQKLITACSVIALSFVVITFGTIKHTSQSKPVEITYFDLQPEVREQVDCLADNIYFEAGHEPKEGQKAVALVTMNRMVSGTFPDTICGVVKQKQRSVCQFSWWCSVKARAKLERSAMNREVYEQVRQVALDVYLNYHMIYDITKGALFYHADYVPKSALGMKNLHLTVKIGRHIFYRN